MENNEEVITKGRIILKALLAKRKLRGICENNNISYKFAYAVSEGKKKPSWELMNQFRFLIPCDYWFDAAKKDFIQKVKSTIREEK